MILLGIFAGMFVRYLFPGLHVALYAVIRLSILPLIMGVGYEFIMIAGKHDNLITRIISAPGLWVQRITTKEPTLDMLEVAIVSTKCALRDEFPEFMEFWQARGWEAKPEAEKDGEDTAEISTDESIDTQSEGSSTANDEGVSAQSEVSEI